MAITITITDPTPEQIAALFGPTPIPDMPPSDEPKQTRSRKPKDEPAPDAEETAEERGGEQGEEEAGPTKEDAEKAARALVGANGREAMAEALAKFKAANLSSLKESDYAKFIAHCEKAIK